MASPQVENGHTRVSNELLEAIYRFPFSSAQLRFVLWVMRSSFGWSRKKTEAKSLAELNDETRVPKASVGWAIVTLLKAGVIMKDDMGRYSLNKNFDEWMIQASDRLPLSNPLDEKTRKPSNPLDESSNPLDEIVQPIGRSYKELKQEKQGGKKGGARTRETFIPPTIEEVVAYCSERKALGKPAVNPHKWFDHYTANGWRVGRTKMVDWKAAVRTWEHSDFGGGSPRPHVKGGAAPVEGKYAR